MDFLRIYFLRNETLLSWTFPVIKIRFSFSNVLIRGESNPLKFFEFTFVTFKYEQTIDSPLIKTLERENLILMTGNVQLNRVSFLKKLLLKKSIL